MCLRLEAPFRPSATYFDGAKVGKTLRSVSGPTSSGSFALTLIRGPVQLARRPASHPPDQRQGSAVTYVALCGVSAIAVTSTLFQLSCDAPRRHAILDALRPLCALCVTQRFCEVSDVCLRPKAPFRPSASYFDGAKVGKTLRSVSGPTSSGSFALTLIRGVAAIHGPGAACSASCIASPGSASGLSRHLRRTLRRQCHRDKKALSFNYRATLRVGMQFWTLCVLCVAMRVTQRFCEVSDVCF
ncbi:hypothetical protein SAMN05444064_111169 [Pseudomonas syringae]|nr:hypothetical protein SAMN05444514_12391 [Pseudomonas syringae]SFM23117.1 hypothetical protein SAMN05444064_111169 [Pseudomonas syringae]